MEFAYRMRHKIHRVKNLVIPVLVFGSDRSINTKFDAYVDTGADITTVPELVLRRLGYESYNKCMIRTASGEIVETNIYYCSIIIDGVDIKPHTQEVIGTDNNRVFIGMSMLEDYDLLLTANSFIIERN